MRLPGIRRRIAAGIGIAVEIKEVGGAAADLLDESLRTCMTMGSAGSPNQTSSPESHHCIRHRHVDAGVLPESGEELPDSLSETDTGVVLGDRWRLRDGSQILGSESRVVPLMHRALGQPVVVRKAETSTVSALGNNNRRVHSPDLSENPGYWMLFAASTHTHLSTHHSLPLGASFPGLVMFIGHQLSCAGGRQWGVQQMRYRFFLYSGVLGLLLLNTGCDGSVSSDAVNMMADDMTVVARDARGGQMPRDAGPAPVDAMPAVDGSGGAGGAGGMGGQGGEGGQGGAGGTGGTGGEGGMGGGGGEGGMNVELTPPECGPGSIRARKSAAG